MPDRDDPAHRIIIALDYPRLEPALDLAARLGPRVGMLKVGLELFYSAGPAALREPVSRGARVFFDAKLYDIPNTVHAAAAAAARLGVSMLNVHCLAGRAVMRAAKEGAARGAREVGLPPPLVIGVTIITSLRDAELRAELGLRRRAATAVPALAALAREAGLDGVVAAPMEVPAVKRACGAGFLAVTPGVRPTWAAQDDQARTATPREALAAGADYLVVGRPITRADDPAAALERLLRELSE